MSKPITRSKQTTERLLIEPEGDSNVAMFIFLKQMQDREERDKVCEAILSRIGGDRPGEIPVPSPSLMEEDVDSYFGAFEDHMEFHDVPSGVSIWDPSLQIWCIWIRLYYVKRGLVPAL